MSQAALKTDMYGLLPQWTAKVTGLQKFQGNVLHNSPVLNCSMQTRSVLPPHRSRTTRIGPPMKLEMFDDKRSRIDGSSMISVQKCRIYDSTLTPKVPCLFAIHYFPAIHTRLRCVKEGSSLLCHDDETKKFNSISYIISRPLYHHHHRFQPRCSPMRTEPTI